MLGPLDAAMAAPLSEVCRGAMAQDPELAAATLAAIELDERLTAARTGFFPRLHLDGELATDRYTRASGYAPLFTRAAELGATEMLYDGGATWHRATASHRERDAAWADRLNTANRVALNDAIATLAVGRGRALLAASERYAALHARAVAQVEAMARADRGKGFDVLQVRARAVYAQSLVAERRAELASSEARFRELTGREAPTLEAPTPLEGPGLESIGQALALGDARHPAVTAARHRREARLASQREAEAAFVPLFNAEARYRTGIDRSGLPGRNDEGYVGVRASVALASNGGQTNAVRAAKAEAERAAARVEAARRDVREAVRVAWDRRAGVASTLPPAEANFAASREIVKGFQDQYRSGQRSVLDLLRVQADAYGAETRVIGLRYDRAMADYELAHSQGRLTEWLAPPELSSSTQVSR